MNVIYELRTLLLQINDYRIKIWNDVEKCTSNFFGKKSEMFIE